MKKLGIALIFAGIGLGFLFGAMTPISIIAWLPGAVVSAIGIICYTIGSIS